MTSGTGTPSENGTDELVEYGLLMSSGGFEIRPPDIEAVYPLNLWIKDKLRQGSHIYRRTVVVVEEWAPVNESTVDTSTV
jgi:hypothetical protein